LSTIIAARLTVPVNEMKNAMKPRRLSPLLLLAPLLFHATASHAVVAYENDFQSAVGSAWSHTTRQDAPTPYPFGPRSFLGEFGNDTVSLNLLGLAPHDSVLLEFDLYLIRSWDGSSAGTTFDYGNDAFKVAVGGGPVLLDKTFSNGNPAGQSFGPLPNNPYYTGAAETYSLGYVFADGIQQTSQVMDSVYRLSFAFAHDADQLTLNFSGYGLQSLNDESWGLDNVRVSAVPEPGVAPLLALGVLTLAWRTRKRLVAG
jgi:hypothetical protein